MPLSATDLLADINQRLANLRPDAPIVAYWYCPDGPRTNFATAITAATRDVVPLKVSGGFQVANQLTNDISNLIAAHRTAFEGRSPPTSERPLVLLLLSRDELRLPQTASAAPAGVVSRTGRNRSIGVDRESVVVGDRCLGPPGPPRKRSA